MPRLHPGLPALRRVLRLGSLLLLAAPGCGSRTAPPLSEGAKPAIGLASAGMAARLSPPASRRSPLASGSLTGDWGMHLQTPGKSFEDRMHLEAGADGAITGTITVPGVFTAPIQGARREGRAFAFEIVAPEQPRPFRVRYEGQLAPDGSGLFVGYATLPETGELLGGFVATREGEPGARPIPARPR